jgi:hypothetical protein
MYSHRFLSVENRSFSIKWRGGLFYVDLCVFDVCVTVHRRHSEGKDRLDATKYVCSFIVSTCFGHQYAHLQEYKSKKPCAAQPRQCPR